MVVMGVALVLCEKFKDKITTISLRSFLKKIVFQLALWVCTISDRLA